jgi:hypothetical protein
VADTYSASPLPLWTILSATASFPIPSSTPTRHFRHSSPLEQLARVFGAPEHLVPASQSLRRLAETSRRFSPIPLERRANVSANRRSQQAFSIPVPFMSDVCDSALEVVVHCEIQGSLSSCAGCFPSPPAGMTGKASFLGRQVPCPGLRRPLRPGVGVYRERANTGNAGSCRNGSTDHHEHPQLMMMSRH